MKGSIVRGDISLFKLGKLEATVFGKNLTCFLRPNNSHDRGEENAEIHIMKQVGTEYDGIAGILTGILDTDKNTKKDETKRSYTLTSHFFINRDRADLILSARELEKKFPGINWNRQEDYSGFIPQDLLEPLVLEIVATFFNIKVKNDHRFTGAFREQRFLYSLFSWYIYLCCPMFCTTLIKQKPLVYDFYDKTELFGTDPIPIGFDEEKLTECALITKDNLHEFLFPVAKKS